MVPVVQPVILSGGSGTRLWPLSRESCPKQFVRLQRTHSLIQNTALRTSDPARYARPLVVSSARHRFMIAAQLQEIGVQPAAILLEPVARNILLAFVGTGLGVWRSLRGARFQTWSPAQSIRDAKKRLGT